MEMATQQAFVPRVTTRAVMDPSRKCALRCEFCYYLPQDDFYSVRPWSDVEADVLAAKARGCDACDITGGEPLQYPEIARLVRCCADNGIRPRIITSLICAERTLDEVLDSGVDDWLISMHGAKAETHDEIVKVPNARRMQVRRLWKISTRMRFCSNYVMVAKNQQEIADQARWLTALVRLPRIVNFINFNPHYSWHAMRDKAIANIVDLSIAGPQLDEAIDELERSGVGVNVRYFPMCALREDHRKNVCNDLHVAFDSGEWDNAIPSHDPPEGFEYGYRLSLGNEEKGDPCNRCDLQWVCGGANRLWHEMSREKFGEQLVPITMPEDDKPGKDFWWYRQWNQRAMA